MEAPRPLDTIVTGQELDQLVEGVQLEETSAAGSYTAASEAVLAEESLEKPKEYAPER